jgi:hypothetical protein
MSYIFKYHPDNVICRNGVCGIPYAEFMENHPDFPLVEGEFFEYRYDAFEIIKIIGNTYIGIIQNDLQPYKNLINAINDLE